MTGEKIGTFIFLRNELKGKNKTWICQCICGVEKVFWKKSAILKTKTCGCGTDSTGLTSKQARSMKTRLQGYKNGAKKRNFEWELSYEEFVKISTQNCFYCNNKPYVWDCMTNSPSLQKDSPNVNPKDYEIVFNGIDRYNSKLGYSLENCVPCCKNCNRAKSDLAFDDFKKHIETIYKWLYQKG
jgi:5-methylcytosine-specific restriction endonuclease McrA